MSEEVIDQGTDKLLSIPQSIIDCMVCLEQYRPDVRERQCLIVCTNGHYMCRRCASSVGKCPVCRLDVMTFKIVNRLMMDLVEVSSGGGATGQIVIEDGHRGIRNDYDDQDCASPYYAEYCDRRYPHIGSLYFTPTDAYLKGYKSSDYRMNLTERIVFASFRNIGDEHNGNLDFEIKFSEDFRRIEDGACFAIDAMDGYWGFDCVDYRRCLDEGNSLRCIGKCKY